MHRRTAHAAVHACCQGALPLTPFHFPDFPGHSPLRCRRAQSGAAGRLRACECTAPCGSARRGRKRPQTLTRLRSFATSLTFFAGGGAPNPFCIRSAGTAAARAEVDRRIGRLPAPGIENAAAHCMTAASASTRAQAMAFCLCVRFSRTNSRLLKEATMARMAFVLALVALAGTAEVRRGRAKDPQPVPFARRARERRARVAWTRRRALLEQREASGGA